LSVADLHDLRGYDKHGNASHRSVLQARQIPSDEGEPVDRPATETPTLQSTRSHQPETRPGHDRCLTLDVTTFLLGRVSMDEMCQFCVLTALAPLHPWQMSIYVVGSDSLFRLAGSFGKGPGQDVLHQYSCLEDPHVGEELRSGHPLATFPLVGMRPEQHLNISDLQDGPQVLWPLSTAHRLVGAMHVRFTSPPDAHAVSADLHAIAGPIALALDLPYGREHVLLPPSANGESNTAASPNGHRMHPSLMGPVRASEELPRALSVVRWTGADPAPGGAVVSAPAEELTPRQRRVLSLMAKGMTNGQIARVLAFSESTVRQETMAIYRTLQVKGRAEAIAYGREHGLIATPPSA
jgi:DNA-binding CsgD family transcriptional regulator